MAVAKEYTSKIESLWRGLKDRKVAEEALLRKSDGVLADLVGGVCLGGWGGLGCRLQCCWRTWRVGWGGWGVMQEC